MEVEEGKGPLDGTTDFSEATWSDLEARAEELGGQLRQNPDVASAAAVPQEVVALRYAVGDRIATTPMESNGDVWTEFWAGIRVVAILLWHMRSSPSSTTSTSSSSSGAAAAADAAAAVVTDNTSVFSAVAPSVTELALLSMWQSWRLQGHNPHRPSALHTPGAPTRSALLFTGSSGADGADGHAAEVKLWLDQRRDVPDGCSASVTPLPFGRTDDGCGEAGVSCSSRALASHQKVV